MNKRSLEVTEETPPHQEFSKVTSSQRDIGQLLEIFLVVATVGSEYYQHLVHLMARGVAKHSAVHRMTSHKATQQRIVCPQISMAPRLGIPAINKDTKPNHILKFAF